MIAYVLDNKTLKTKDILEFEQYEFREDIEYSEKSSITVSRAPKIRDDDLVLCRGEGGWKFIGICETFDSGSGKQEYNITLLQKERLFDREIFVAHEEMLSETGIEDFIAQTIRDNFTESGDDLMDKDDICLEVLTHTRIAAKVDAENGVYNLKTYLGNAKQYYGIFLDFSISGEKLVITIAKRDEPPVPIDIEVSDISDYDEVYSVKALAKLMVNWKLPDTQNENGETVNGASERRQFYLLADRTITEDGSDQNRAAGTVKSIHIEAQTEDEMLQQVYNEFSANEYSHKVTFNLKRDSRLYPRERFYVGRKCTIRTKTGIRTSQVTKAEDESGSAMVALTFGNLKVTLIEKLRR